MDEISSRWHEIGTALDVSFNTLNGLRYNPNPDPVRLATVINTWYTGNDIPTWSMILEAVEGPLVRNKNKGQRIREWLAEDPQFTEYSENKHKKK